jgi:hypothetical protein
MIPAITEYPLAWLVAALNFAALVTALGCSGILAVKKKEKAWIPIFSAILLVYGLSYLSKIRAGIIPVLPSSRIRMVEIGNDKIPETIVSYSIDLLAIGLALGAAIATKQKK